MAKLCIMLDWIPAFAGMTELENKKKLQTKPTLIKFIIIWFFYPLLPRLRCCKKLGDFERGPV